MLKAFGVVTAICVLASPAVAQQQPDKPLLRFAFKDVGIPGSPSVRDIIIDCPAEYVIAGYDFGDSKDDWDRSIYRIRKDGERKWTLGVRKFSAPSRTMNIFWACILKKYDSAPVQKP